MSITKQKLTQLNNLMIEMARATNKAKILELVRFIVFLELPPYMVFNAVRSYKFHSSRVSFPGS